MSGHNHTVFNANKIRSARIQDDTCSITYDIVCSEEKFNRPNTGSYTIKKYAYSETYNKNQNAADFAACLDVFNKLKSK